MNFSIRPTTEADLPEVLSILDEAAAWLQSIGVTEQWPAVISEDGAWTARLSRLAAEGRMYLAFEDEAAAGTFHLRDKPGPLDGPSAWRPDEVDAKPAVYLFTLAVRRRVARRQVGAAMLDWAFEAARGRGRVLRLDCWAGNEKLRRFYLDCGFEYRGDVEGAGSDGRCYEVSRFERRQ
jgi:GNAT superfamily N-acetyltransferase